MRFLLGLREYEPTHGNNKQGIELTHHRLIFSVSFCYEDQLQTPVLGQAWERQVAAVAAVAEWRFPERQRPLRQ